MKEISIELRRAVKCWRRRYLNPKITNAKKTEAKAYGGNEYLKHHERLNRNGKRVCRAAREYEENLIFNFEDDSVVLIWISMYHEHQIYLVGRSIDA